MTEKRFTLEMQYWKGNPQGRKLFDNLTGQDGMSVEELCNIASALHCKCEELKIVLEVYEDSLNKLEKENKELKKENQHIKNTIKEAYNNERTQLGKSVLKQLMEAIQ
jgi:DNA anti-recombination protein RmuC